MSATTPTPARPSVSYALRESFCVLFERPEDEAALRRVFGLVYDVVLEGRAQLEGHGPVSSIWRQSIRGAIGDLRQAADQLADVTRDLDEAGSGGRQVMRAMLAIADAAVVVLPLADQLDAVLAEHLAAPAEGS